MSARTDASADESVSLSREQKADVLGMMMCNGYRTKPDALGEVVAGGLKVFVDHCMRVNTTGLRRADYRGIYIQLRDLSDSLGLPRRRQ